jgi:hypothetical protein
VPTFSRTFHINKTQAELDFVDVSLATDNLLFIDPFALAQRLDRWSHECHLSLIAFFQRVVDDIRAGHNDRARELLLHLREPNETRLGFSAHRPQGAGIGNLQADELFVALRASTAVQTGFLSSLEECELMIDGIGRDKISDLTTNIIRGKLADYTKEQCILHGVPVQQVALSACFDPNAQIWAARYADLPAWRQSPIVLVPKAIVRSRPAYDYRRYYRHSVLPFLQAEHIDARSSLVRALKNGELRVYKKDLEARYPCTKDFLYEFSRQHPEVLHQYRNDLEQLERVDRNSEVDPANEAAIAAALVLAMRAIEAGSLRAHEYHALMIGVVEFLFYPKLLYPQKEQEIHEGRKRIDIVMSNGAHDGVFHHPPSVRQFPCAYVPFECKNHTTEVANPELDQLAGRFSANRGRLGFLCCRHFEDRELFIRRCRDTFTDVRGLILPIDDRTVIRFLDLVERGRRQEIDREVENLVAEVWLG